MYIRMLSKAFFIMAIAMLLTCCTGKQESIRERMNFYPDWKFQLSDPEGAYAPEFDDSGWRLLDLPHDWSIEGTFSDTNRSSPGGGALPGGIGWYRKQFRASPSDKEKLVYVEFDGVYRNSEVWING